MSQASSHASPREILWDLIKDIRFGMLTTTHPNGHLHSRPVTTQNKDIDEADSLWFFMSRSGDPLRDIAAEPEVNVAYAHPGKDAYVSVSGHAAIVEDAAKKQALWSEMAKAWFPGGVNDPDLALVRVQISHAHYWDIKENKLVQLYEMAKAAIGGQRPQHLGRTGEVRMS
jgi:general stress protein 26